MMESLALRLGWAGRMGGYTAGDKHGQYVDGVDEDGLDEDEVASLVKIDKTYRKTETRGDV